MKIIVIRDDKPIDEITFTGGVALIGRKSDCDVSIKDPAVSGKHAKLEKIGGDYVIEDLDSTNGIHIKGRRVKKQLIKNEDVILIGEHKLRFIIGDSSLSPKENVREAKTETAKGFLKVLSGSKAGQAIPLEEGLTTIGEPGVQVAAVSRRPQGHFIIHVDGGEDRNRVPLVNGEPTGFKSRKLEDGDKIEVAGIKMEYSSS